MLCPECRRMVGKDGYCPRGHLARPELQMQPPKAAPPPLRAAPAVPAAPPAARVPSGDTPALPPLPPEQLFGAKSRRSGRTTALIVSIVVVAVAIFAFFFLGNSAGASNLKVVFTPGETHTYALEMTMKGKGGNLQGGFSTSISLGADLTQTTGAVDKDGNATINYTLKNFHYSEDGRHTIPPGAGAAFSVRMRPDGTIIGLEGGDPFGLEDISPAGQFVNPSNAGPLLPKTKVTPGESWTVTAKESLPDLGTIKATAVNTLLERRKIDGNDAAVIHSIVNVPLNLRLGPD